MYISEAMSDKISYNHLSSEEAEPERFTTHCHDRCELIFLIRGEVSYIAEGRTYDLKGGDIVLSRPSVMHRILPRSRSGYERYDVIINEKLLPPEIWERLKHGRDVYSCQNNGRIFDLFSKLDFYYPLFPEEEYAHLVFNIMEEVFYNLTLSDTDATRADTNQLIDAAIAYIRDNLVTIKDVEEVSSALYITKSHLHHLFSKHLQITPAKYICSKRLILAQKLLKRGRKPTSVYSDCGFDDYATFFRNYKRHFGYSPAYEGKISISREIMS